MLTDDGLVVRGARRLAAQRGLTETNHAADPTVVVVDLERAGALDEIKELRARHSTAIIAGHLASPRQDLWLAAERAGCDVVANRGALASKLAARLAATGGRRSRYPLFPADDIVGRLGLVRRIDDTPVGAVAVYHVGAEVYAVQDTCPHAGATLSEGALEGSVVTCPRHGSRFDVRTGERLRGPADVGIRSFPVEQDGGLVYVVDVGT